jgi:isoquinoline 1-oxidoreductase beta subunit
MPDVALSRREFLQVSGGAGVGLVVAFWLPARALPATPAAAAGGELNAYVRVAPDGTVIFSIAKSEMGQGVLTSLALLLAEELDADWTRVRSEHALSDEKRYGRWSTGGSSSVRTGFEPLRRAGATARELLVAAACEQWKVPREQVSTEAGEVIHRASGRRLAYGQLAARAAALTPPADAPLKPREQFRLIGKGARRLDTPAKLDGSAIFGIDVRVPGMLFAQVARPPELGGKAASLDASAALAVEGVRRVVEIPNGVAVVGTGFWPVSQGRQKLKISWTPGPHAALDGESIRERCRAGLARDGAMVRDDGDTARALASAARRVEAVYEFPYLAHAALEPMNCTARVEGDRCELWVPTQSPTGAAEAAARITGLAPDRIRVNTALLGGGFGRRSATDFVEDAVHLSKLLGAPVQVVYTREDDMRAGLFRPTGANALVGGLDAEGWPVAWQHRIASQSIMRSQGRPLRDGIDGSSVEGAKNLPYAIPNIRVTWVDVELPVSTHWWRSVGSSQNAWVTECFFDELCAAGKKDPVEARLRLLSGHPRHARVLELAAREAGWGKPAAEGRALGAAVHESFGSIVAQVAEVSLEPDGTPRVHRVTCAVDCGDVVHPDGVRAQMEGAIAFGLSAALWGEVAIEAGRIATANFDRYPIVRMGQMPRVDTHIVAQGDPMGGIGEPGTPPIAPAVCNALLRLTGRPVRRLPIGRVERA